MNNKAHTSSTTRRDQALTITVDEAAVLLGISRASAYLGVKAGDIPSVRVGGRILVPRARLLEMLGERSGAATVDQPGGKAA